MRRVTDRFTEVELRLQAIARLTDDTGLEDLGTPERLRAVRDLADAAAIHLRRLERGSGGQ